MCSREKEREEVERREGREGEEKASEEKRVGEEEVAMAKEAVQEICEQEVGRIRFSKTEPNTEKPNRTDTAGCQKIKNRTIRFGFSFRFW